MGFVLARHTFDKYVSLKQKFTTSYRYTQQQITYTATKSFLTICQIVIKRMKGSNTGYGTVIIGLLCLPLFTACGTMPNGRSWGQDVTLTPSLQRLTDAATHAAEHTATWLPLAGAALFSIGNLDEKYTYALADHNPIFGSQEKANHASDILRSSLVTSAMATALLTPSGDNNSDWMTNKSKGMITDPSGHTSRAFAAAALTSNNLDSLALSPGTADGIRVGLYTVACGTAWARVEAEKHYITDVMAGAALGNFLSRFIHDAFMGLDNNDQQIEIEIEPKYSHLAMTWHF